MTLDRVFKSGFIFAIIVVVTLVVMLGMTYKRDVKLVTRDFEVEQVNYKQSAQNILDMFSEPNYGMDGYNASFNGSLKFDTKNYGIDFLASGADELVVKYSTRYDLKSNLFYVITSFYASGVLVQQTEAIYVPQYDTLNDDVYFDIEDSRVSIKEILGEVKEDCLVWFIPAICGVVAALFVAVAVPVVTNPSFYQPVADGINAVANSVWGWFTGLFKSEVTTVDKYVVLTSAQLDEVKRGPTNNKVYQIAYINKADQLQVSKVCLNWIEAIALLHFVKPLNAMMNSVEGLLEKISGVDIDSLGEQAKVDAQTLKNESKIGVYTKQIIDAGKLAWAVGARENSSGEFKAETHNTNVGSKYYYHFHDASHTIHIWYGNPI